MASKEIRIARLKQLQAEIGARGPVELGRAIGRKTNQTSDLLHGRTSFGEKVARSIEEFAGLPMGWLDRPETTVRPPGAAREGLGLPSAFPFEVAVPPLGPPPLQAGAEALPASPSTFVGEITLSANWVAGLGTVSRLSNLRHLQMPDDLMEPTLGAGDLLLVDIGVSSYVSDGIYVLAANDRLFVRRVRQRLDGSFEVSADSAAVKSADILTAAQLQPTARVLWTWRGKKV